MISQNGSIPASVMRTGALRPFSPSQARQDIDTAHVLEMTDMTAATALMTALPSSTTASVAQTVTAVPPAPIQTPSSPMPLGSHSKRHAWHQQHHRQHPAIADIRRLHPNASLQGAEAPEMAEWQGRPVAKFDIAASPPPVTAHAAAQSLRHAAKLLQSGGFSNMPPELIAGPLAALMRGGAVELHFANGVVIRTAL